MIVPRPTRLIQNEMCNGEHMDALGWIAHHCFGLPFECMTRWAGLIEDGSGKRTCITQWLADQSKIPREHYITLQDLCDGAYNSNHCIAVLEQWCTKHLDEHDTYMIPERTLINDYDNSNEYSGASHKQHAANSNGASSDTKVA